MIKFFCTSDIHGHGHWHNSAYWSKKLNLPEFGNKAIFDTYIDDENKVIGLDAVQFTLEK